MAALALVTGPAAALRRGGRVVVLFALIGLVSLVARGLGGCTHAVAMRVLVCLCAHGAVLCRRRVALAALRATTLVIRSPVLRIARVSLGRGRGRVGARARGIGRSAVAIRLPRVVYLVIAVLRDGRSGGRWTGGSAARRIGVIGVRAVRRRRTIAPPVPRAP